MSRPKRNINHQTLNFHATPEHECSYLPGKNAITLFTDPDFPMQGNIYSTLSSQGFRRSGKHVYKPKCSQCNAFIAVRLSVDTFAKNRNQKRNWARNSDLRIIKTSAQFNSEHYILYKRYLAAKHPDSGMDNPDPENYMSFLKTEWATTVFYEFRKTDTLLAVAVIDELTDGLSAVYTFYDPDSTNRSLGRYAILTEIEIARNHDLQWLYLGYWIADCTKMKYKNEYQPLEYFHDNAWHDHPPENAD